MRRSPTLQSRCESNIRKYEIEWLADGNTLTVLLERDDDVRVGDMAFLDGMPLVATDVALTLLGKRVCVGLAGVLDLLTVSCSDQEKGVRDDCKI